MRESTAAAQASAPPLDGVAHVDVFVSDRAAAAQGFLAWQRHLEAVLQQRVEAVDHQLSWSLYFSDPDGNPFEITSTEVAPLHAVLGGSGDSRRPA